MSSTTSGAPDLSGTLLIEALRRAAARGVRVRLLLDDANTSGLDEPLAALAALPNVEVRLFNPFPGRGPRSLGYLLDFERLNRRMHNKSFTVDNLASVVGGRNVGDEYFEAGHDVLFVDLDALAIGPVVGDVSSNFDQYWASDSAYPAAAHRSRRSTPRRAPPSTPRRRRSTKAPKPTRIEPRSPNRPWSAICSRTACPSSGRRCAWSATTPPRAWGSKRPISCCGRA